jgi:DNA-binding winged helix-turn-helix (wHTH) protein/Tol biopolymer transport system component
MTTQTAHNFRFGAIEVHEQEFRATRAGEPVAIEPKAFRVLLYLLHHAGHLVTKNELLDAVWGETAVTESSLTRAIALLRRVLEDDPHQPRFIETVSTAGYRFICPVASDEDVAAVSTTKESIAAGEFTEAANLKTAAAPAAAVAGRTAKKARWAWVGGLAVAILLAGGYWYLSRPLPPPRITSYTQITQDGRSKTLGGTDGSRLYFTQSSPNSIAQVGVNGGEIAQLPIAIPGVDVFLRDISPDGSNALIGIFPDEGPLGNPQWVAPVLGGAARRLENGQRGAFSPDGGSVIYSTLSGDIFMVRIDGSDKHKLASVGSIAGGFSWSPDGKSIRFDRDGQFWEMSSDGSGIHRLLPDWKEPGSQCCECCGRWTPDGRFYLFRLFTQSAGGQIWALDERRGLFRPRPSTPIRLTSGPVHWSDPFPSRDGKQVFAEGYTLRGELSRIDPKTGSFQPFLGGISAEFVSFSPDGNFVAYVAFPEGTLWKANRDGSNRMQLTGPTEQGLNPRWSPNSKEIVFMIETPDGHYSIRRVSAADGTPLWIVPKEAADTADPNWSPDGTKVLYNTAKEQIIGAATADLRIVDLKTRQVTVVPNSAGKWSPRWSPDGRYIAALLSPQVDRLPVFDVKLQRWFDLSVNGEVEFPSFSRDSKFIYFLRNGKDQGVFRVPVTGGKVERVVDMANWHVTGYFGYSMSLDPNDAPLVLRDTGSDDIYALAFEAN